MYCKAWSVAKAAEARSSAQWPDGAFHYIFNSAEFPAEQAGDCLLFLPPLHRLFSHVCACLGADR